MAVSVGLGTVGGGDGGTDSEGTDRTVSMSTGGRTAGGGLGPVDGTCGTAGVGVGVALLQMGLARMGSSCVLRRPLIGAQDFGSALRSTQQSTKAATVAHAKFGSPTIGGPGQALGTAPGDEVEDGLKVEAICPSGLAIWSPRRTSGRPDGKALSLRRTGPCASLNGEAQVLTCNTCAGSGFCHNS